MRANIANLVVADLFDDTTEELDVEREAITSVLLSRIYNGQIPEERDDLWEHTTFVQVYSDQTRTESLSFYLNYGRRHYINPPPITDAALYTRINNWCTQHDAQITKIQDVTIRVRNLLGVCTTTKQVIEAWPDGEKYVRQLFINDATEERVIDDRRKYAARIAEVFLEHGVDVVTPTAVEPEVADEAQTV